MFPKTILFQTPMDTTAMLPNHTASKTAMLNVICGVAIQRRSCLHVDVKRIIFFLRHKIMQNKTKLVNCQRFFPLEKLLYQWWFKNV